MILDLIRELKDSFCEKTGSVPLVVTMSPETYDLLKKEISSRYQLMNFKSSNREILGMVIEVDPNCMKNNIYVGKESLAVEVE